MKRMKKLFATMLCLCVIAAGVGLPAQVHGSEKGEDYLITDNYPDLEGWLSPEKLGTATKVKVTASNISTKKTVLPSQVSLFSGWEKSSLFGTDEAKTRDVIGYGDESVNFTFAAGSTPTVQFINFKMPDGKLVIPQGVTVTFKNCSFSDTIVNKGTATFDNCQFKNGKIENSGTASYTGGTVEPENTFAHAHEPLTLELKDKEIKDAAVGKAYEEEFSFVVEGTNADKAKVTAKVDSGFGIEAKVENGKVLLSGTPTKTGSVTVTVRAEAQGDEPVIKTLSFNVNQVLSLRLDGKLDSVIKGQTGYHSSLKVFVKEGDGPEVDYYDYRNNTDGAVLKVDISPEDSGMTATYWFDRIVVSGTPAKAGTYQVVATLEHKGQTVRSDGSPLRIYEGNETLKGQFATLDPSDDSWDMEPYVIGTSDNAVVPLHLKTIYGSHQSGTYGIIGNNKSLATDTIVIPAGSDVTFENMKFYSSVKIVVEKGGSLTLKDSVAFGPIQVNGGTFSMDKDSSLTDTLTLNDGSTLKGADIHSNARFLTDGADKEDVPTMVIVNGKVTALGNNKLRGDTGSGDLPGQTTLQVNGELVIPDGSVLEVIGGGDKNYAPGHIGGTGILLQDGTIYGEGTLIATGGVGNDGPGGDGITGKGTIKVARLISSGGDSVKIIDKLHKGGDAVGKEVVVTTKNLMLTGGKGDPEGSAVVTLTEEPQNDPTSPNEMKETDKEKTDEKKPGKIKKISIKKTSPKTGDSQDTLGLLMLMLASGSAVAGLGYRHHRKTS